jgi:ankyrin repeat protein
MLLKIKNLSLILIVNLLGLTVINAMEIDPAKMHELSQEPDEFQSLLASVHYNPTAAYAKVLLNDSLEETEKEAILNKLGCYGADKELATELDHYIYCRQNINKGFLTCSIMPTPTHLSFFKSLIDLVSNLNIRDSYGSPALMLAIDNDNWEAAKLLIKSGPDLDIQDSSGCTALIKIIQKIYFYKTSSVHERNELRDRMDIVQLLLDSGANPNIRSNEKKMQFNDQGVYPTHLTMKCKSNKGWTAAMYAAFYGLKELIYGSKEIIELLVEKGANISIKDEEGYTPIDIAEQEGHQDIANYLKEILQQKDYMLFINIIAEAYSKDY